ncbi:hypothetical protein GCM10022254_16810 [Actinomadura meridiana]|uniref:Uncharacterized protein n=1 Tax=Actinomadura meridiana TaxID=559626 RepID=A0ABP8BWI2_9ACTN
MGGPASQADVLGGQQEVIAVADVGRHRGLEQDDGTGLDEFRDAGAGRLPSLITGDVAGDDVGDAANDPHR